MKSNPLLIALGLASASAAYGQFTPIPLDPSSFNHDIVVEVDAMPGLVSVTIATVDEGTGNTGSTWFEAGYNAAAQDSGLPPAGTEFTSVSSANHVYRMAPSYTAANGVLINTTATEATLTPTTPAAYAALSFLTSGGRGGGQINVTVTHADGSTQESSIFSPDWFNGTDPAWIAYGRVNAQNFTFDTQGSITDPGNPRLYSRDVTLNNTTSPVTSIKLTYGSGASNAHNGVMAVSGATTAGGAFTPIAVTGYTHDFVDRLRPGERAKFYLRYPGEHHGSRQSPALLAGCYAE